MSSARNQGRVPQSAGDTQHNVRDAALRGAALAFSKPSPKSKPPTNTYTGGNNGALLAATKVGTGGSPAALKRDLTGGSVGVSRPNLSKSPSSNALSVPGDPADRAPSPSNIAAKLAAARGSPMRPKPQPVAAPAPTMSERQPNERDILPPSGSVGNVLARMESKKPIQQPPKRRDSLGSQSVASTARENDQDKPTDDTPIPPTNSLVKMFEQARPTTPTKPATEPLHVTRTSPPPVRSPKPQRAFKLPPEPMEDAPLQRTRTKTPPPVKPKPKPKIDLPPPRSTDGAEERAYFNTPKKDPVKSPVAKQKPVQPPTIKTKITPQKTTPQKGSGQVRPKSQDAAQSPSLHRRRFSTSMESYKTPSSPSSFKSAKEEQEEEKEKEEKVKPNVPPPRRSATRKADVTPTTSRLQPSAPINITPRTQSQNPSPMNPAQKLTPPRRPTSAAGRSSPSVYHNNYQRESVKQITKHMTGESLSSAIMGAALAASSRNVSPAPRPDSVEPLFPPRKHHHHSPFHRSPSPPKQSPPKSTGKLRTTMRKDPSSSDDEDKVDKYKKKGTRIMGIKGRKHPNKHHEGTRKRWRDQITERERKRYEGVWAANKGLFLAPPESSVDDPSLDVLNLCVKEIWMRSRLPIHVLEEIWDLVDSRGVGRLSRWEFVVGLWLIDQRLKGRKLPTRVSDSVWQSARGVGIKVKIRH